MKVVLLAGGFGSRISEESLALLRKLYEDPKAYAEFIAQPRFMHGAEDKIYAYYERLEDKLRQIFEKNDL